jgi:hypothetical protein
MGEDLHGQQADLLRHLQELVDSQVVSTLKWYQRHALWPRRWFRSSGVMVILLSVAIPLLAALDYQGKELVLSSAAVLIAALTGVNAFFKWEDVWRSRRQTEFALAYLLAVWRLEVLQALHEPDPVKGKDLAIAATRQLLEEARAATGEETKEFFSRVVWPKGGEPST